MTFGRERRLLLAWLALLAPLPLLFNDVLEWPVLLVHAVAMAFLLRRSGRDADTWLPNWAMNLLGLAYLPVLWFDFSLFSRGQLLRPLLHLAIFTLIVKLYALKRDRDAWQAFAGSLFLSLAALGTSVHPSVVLYLALILFLHLLVMARFTAFHLLGRFAPRQGFVPVIPLARFLALATALTLLGAVPIFFVLPRIRSPYIVASGALGPGLARGGGVSATVGLDATSRSRTNRSVALRFSYLPPGGELPEVRFKLATYDRFTGNGWQRSPPDGRTLQRGRDGLFRLAPGRYGKRLRVWRLPVSSAELPVPVQAVTVDLPAPTLFQRRDGSVALSSAPHALVEYVVGLAGSPVSDLPSPAATASGIPSMDRTAIDSRVVDLARRLAGEGSPRTRAARIESELATRYGYTLDLVGRGGGDPIGRFLFSERRGHCELFATSMVLMLRAEGIPARFVVGYLGADRSNLEDYWVVRQSHRHAWVEAYLPDDGWRLFDPTPAVGRPGTAEVDFGMLLSEAWDYVAFRWDRYVLTYGVGDQLDLAFGLRSWLDRIGSGLSWSGLDPREWFDSSAEEALSPVEESPPSAASPNDVQGWFGRAWPLWVVVALVVVWFGWRGRRLSARTAWLRLRRRLRSNGLELTDSVPPQEIHRRLAESFPAAAEPAARVLEFYLQESFGEQSLEGEERTALRADLGATLRELRRVG